ncbi:MAG TPA: CPBP family intramembrane glutamic endopeptidase, partial [Planctomycetota bacterium]|nr:CPBP family intramembrane glutamic endopeptidase [Planctomycetota bacterium]
RWMRHLDLVAVVLVIFVRPLAAHLLNLFEPPGTQPGPDPYSPRELLGRIPFDLGMAVILLLLLRSSGSAVQPRPTPRSEWTRELLLGLALGFGLFFAVYACSYVAIRLGIPGNDSAWLPLRQRSDSRIAFTIAALFSSTYEEVAFRAFLQARLQDALPRARFLPVILSAAAFSLAHGYSPLASIGIYLFGLLTGLAYRRWRRIPRLVVAHWFFNALTVWH